MNWRWPFKRKPKIVSQLELWAVIEPIAKIQIGSKQYYHPSQWGLVAAFCHKSLADSFSKLRGGVTKIRKLKVDIPLDVENVQVMHMNSEPSVEHVVEKQEKKE